MRLLIFLAVTAAHVLTRRTPSTRHLYEDSDDAGTFNETTYLLGYPTYDEWNEYNSCVGEIKAFKQCLEWLNNPSLGMYNESYNLMLSSSKNFRSPQRLASVMQKYSLAAMEKVVDEDLFCTRKSLEDSRATTLAYMEKMVETELTIHQMQELEEPVKSIEAIRGMIEDTSNATSQYIANYKNSCWDRLRIYYLINTATTEYPDGNITKKADYLIDVISKWHAEDDKFVVIAKPKQCPGACGFQDAYKTSDFFHHIDSLREFTIMRTRSAINNSQSMTLKRETMLEEIAQQRENATCVDASRYFIDNLSTRLRYMAIHENEECAPIIRTTHPDTVFTTQITLDDETGKKKSFHATMVFKCIQNVSIIDGSRSAPDCNF